MKKLLLAALTSGLMTTSAFAWDSGTITEIYQYTDGTLKIMLLKEDGSTMLHPVVVLDVEVKKAMFAMALTARTANIPVDLNYKETDGGWNAMKMK